ncbi:thiol reductant ABC exporter subunit CydC [Boudabousia tangfeifanii]|uniref:Thiol reductant ABC exporter subunit CydC n=1 Tax=Boudabousia tangfeifanii TaxID=1912795 RepID=A0A1D9MKI6_9ACTO|nr:thiol reductant ABC exporter subunit CydC [Boudabousia tangfeifanii]AOZ72738.1 thiol reductant ABC exporter subunit CydC [Boudabousia tangfeifanii]
MLKILTTSERRALDRIFPQLELSKTRLAWAVFLGALALGSSVGLAAVSAWLIARASQMPPVMYLNVAVVSVRALGISKALFRYVERLVSHHLALSGVVNLRTNVYRQIANLRSDIVAASNRGQILSRATTDVDAIGDFVVRSLHPILVTSVVSIFTVVGLAFINIPAAVWVALCLFASAYVGLALTARATREASIIAREFEAKLTASSIDLLENGAEIEVLGLTSKYSESLEHSEAQLLAARTKVAKRLALANAIDTLCLGLAILGTTVIGSWALANGQIAAVNLAVLVLTPMAAFEGTAMLAPAASQLVRSGAAAQALIGILDNPVDAPTKQLPEQVLPSLEAKDLAIGWSADRPIFTGLNLELKPGKSIAIIGRSGIGKTTLLLTLAGLIPPLSGRAQLSGIDSWQLSRHDASRIATLTAEDAHLFGTSVLENLRVARGDLSEAEALELLAQVQLGDWIASLPAGVHTKLANDGKTLSGGERRRLLVARALASNSPLLLLDEPAEHLDQLAARQLLDDLLKLTQSSENPRGLIIVTHNYDGLSAYDEILELSDKNGITEKPTLEVADSKVVFTSTGSFPEADTKE